MHHNTQMQSVQGTFHCPKAMISAKEHATEPLVPVVPFRVRFEIVDEDENGWQDEYRR